MYPAHQPVVNVFLLKGLNALEYRRRRPAKEVIPMAMGKRDASSRVRSDC